MSKKGVKTGVLVNTSFPTANKVSKTGDIGKDNTVLPTLAQADTPAAGR